MELNKIIEILETLPEDAGLSYPENWAKDALEWSKESVIAIQEATKILKSSNVVGTLNIGDKKYIISE